jgi:hypothetical protein
MKVIGISGFARCGKDTFVGIASDILRANGYLPMRVAFADKLKDEVEAMLKINKYKATVKTDDTVLKSMIRPLMVWWGCQRRYESDMGMYWVNEVDNQLNDICIDYLANGKSHDNVVILVSDVRFANEAKWVHEKWDGEIIHLRRWRTEWKKCGQDGSDECAVKVYDPAPNEEEAKQDPLVEAVSDVKVEWENQKECTTSSAINNQKLKEIVWESLNQTKHFKFPKPIIGKPIQ